MYAVMTALIPAWATRGTVAIWPIIEQFSSPIVQVILTPFLFYRLDAEQFGKIVIAQSLLIAAPTLSIGRSAALLSVLPRCSESDRPAQARGMALSVVKQISVFTLGLLLLVLFLNQIIQQSSQYAASELYFILTIFLLAFTDVETTLSCILKSYHLFKATALIELFSRLVQACLTIALISHGALATTVLLVLLVTALVKVLLKWAVFERSIPTPEQPSPRDNERYKYLQHIGFWTWVNVLGALGFYSFDRWAVGTYLGSAALAAYAVCNQLAQLTHTVPAAAGQILIPWAASRTRVYSYNPKALRIHEVAIVSALLAGVPALVMIAFGPYVLSIWISPIFANNYGDLLRHFSVIFFLLALNIPFFNILIGWGQARYAAILTLFASACVVVATLSISPKTLIGMANLKLIFAGISLWFAVRFFKTLKLKSI